MAEDTTPIEEVKTETTKEYAGGKAIASFVLGLIGLISWIIPILSYASCIPGLIIGIQARKKAKSWQATAGITLCIISLVLALINSILGVIMNLSRIA